MATPYDAVLSNEPLNTKSSSRKPSIAGIELSFLETRSRSSSDTSDNDQTTYGHISPYHPDTRSRSELNISYQPVHDQNRVFHGPNSTSRHRTSHSDLRLLPSHTHTYRLERYILRTVLNTLGPIIVLVLYTGTVYVYLQRPTVNDVVPYYPINAKVIFYAWVLLSIFILDWAKSGLAGFEASALMSPKLAPRSALGFMWHADRSWGSVSGWWKALKVMYNHLSPFQQGSARNLHEAQGPGLLWSYLAISSLLLYVATPLASLSMELKQAYAPSDHPVTISGPGQTGYDIRATNAITEQVNSRWRQGDPTTPQGDTIFYASQGTPNVSSTYFDDAIRARYDDDNAPGNNLIPHGPITFFSGPRVSERVHGRAWGLLTELSCSVANPYTELGLLQVRGIDDWSVPRFNSTSRRYNESSGWDSDSLQKWKMAQFEGGIEPVFFSRSSSAGLGAAHAYLISVDSFLSPHAAYANMSAFPTNGSLELVLWQTYEPLDTPDQIYENLTQHPSVVSSFSSADNLTYQGYAVRCKVDSYVGFAQLDAGSRTFSDFTKAPSKPISLTNYGLNSIVAYPGVVAIQSIVYGAFTTSLLGWYGPPACDARSGSDSLTCNPWYGANIATGGSFLGLTNTTQEYPSHKVQLPTITPARMKLAMYKLFGEATVAIMGSGDGPWIGELRGLKPASALVPGIVPWQLVLFGLLCPWVFITVMPNLWTLTEKRWASTLDGLQLFRLGAEWKDAVWKFSGSDITKCESLRVVPGMIGDAEVDSQTGFIGLTKNVAPRDKTYVFDRSTLVST